MTVRYNGTRVERRLVIGPVTGALYPYCTGQPNIRMNPLDFLFLQDIKEHGEPRFVSMMKVVVAVSDEYKRS